MRRERAQPLGFLARRSRLRLSLCADERPHAAPRFEDPGALELAIHPRDGVGVDLQLHGELPHGRQLVAGVEAAGGDGGAEPAFELGVNRRRVAGVYGDDPHLHAYTSSLVQLCQALGSGFRIGDLIWVCLGFGAGGRGRLSVCDRNSGPGTQGWGLPNPNSPRIPNPKSRQGYFLIIFRVSAAMIILPSFSITSPVTSTVWLTCGTILALLSAARPPASW